MSIRISQLKDHSISVDQARYATLTNSGKLFADELTEWLIKEGFVQSQCQMSIYYKYAHDVSKIVVLSYVDDCVYWYTNEDIGKWFVDNLGKIFHFCGPS